MPYDPGPEPPMICGYCLAGIWSPPAYWRANYPEDKTVIYPYCSAQCSLDDYEEIHNGKIS